MPRVRVKFCGVMTPGDAALAARAGADAVGMILHPAARRFVDANTAAAIVRALPPYVTGVGVFVDALPAQICAAAAAAGIRTVQLHGDEPADDVDALAEFDVVKAVRVDPAAVHATLAEWRDALAAGRCRNLVGLLLDTAAGGGTGVANDFGLIAALQREHAFDGLPPIILAGGLTPDNVAAAVALRPYAVDVSSGIEASFGVKSDDKMHAFMTAVTAVAS